MNTESIGKRVGQILATLPDGVTLVAAAKTRTPEEVVSVIEAGVTAVGHNYVQEAESMVPVVGQGVSWHLIGHLQRNKAKKAVALFDLIETLDSWRLADALERHCAAADRTMPVLIEINSGEESSKTGVRPAEVDALVRRVSGLEHIRVQGVMTMGPRFGDPEEARPYFRLTREVFKRLKDAQIPHVEMRYLSMGMSNTYEIAIEEGANIVRIGTRLFGERA